MKNLTNQILKRIETLARISEEPGRLTRTYGSAAMHQANELAAQWMRQAGMSAHEDLAGNLSGLYDAGSMQKAAASRKARASERPILVIGSHLDTVRNAGKFDGILGVLLGIACVERLRCEQIRLPFNIQVVAFADEEGVRFQSAYLGSRVATGRMTEAELSRADSQGITVAEAIEAQSSGSARSKIDGRTLSRLLQELRKDRFTPTRLLGYLEAHIEQGPVLEHRDLALGVVSAIAGQSRLRVRFTGKAGHAGACPMSLRRDALCGAAELVLAAEELGRTTDGLVATAGCIQAEPNASNVVPGAATLSLDVRHQTDAVRRTAVDRLRARARKIAVTRRLKVSIQGVQQEAAAPCSAALSDLLKRAVRRHQAQAPELPSGAGHDAVMMAGITPMAMLFIRCKEGLSHHPAESVKAADIRVALEVMCEFVRSLAVQANSESRKEEKT